MGRVENQLQGVQPIGNDGAPFVNELKEQGPAPRERADLDRLSRELNPNMTTAERNRLSAEIFGASQEEIIKSEAIVWNVLIQEAQAKFPELQGKTGAEIGPFLEDLKTTNPAEHTALMNKVAEETIKAYEAAGINPEGLAVLWQKALSSTGNGLSSAASGLANMSPQGMLATALMGGGTFLLTGSKGWALGIGGLTAVWQSDEATDFLTEQAMPAVGRTAVQGITVLAKAAALPGHALNNIMNGQPMQIANDLSRFAAVDVNNAMRVILGGEALPNGDQRILVQAMRELMAKDTAVAPPELKPILTIILSGTPEQKAALSRDQLAPAIDYLIKARDLGVGRVDHIRLIQKRFRGEDLSIAERQQLILAQSRNVIEGYLKSNPQFDYEALVQERFRALEAANGGTAPTFASLDNALPPSAALQNHDFKMPPEYINNFLQSKGIEMPKYGTEWLLWAYMLMTMITPMVTGVTRAFSDRSKEKPDRTPNEPEVKKGQAEAIASAIGNGKTNAFIGALVTAGVISAAHRAEIEETMGEEFKASDFESLKDNLDTELRAEKIAALFYADFEKAYPSSNAIAESQRYTNNKAEMAKINNWITNYRGSESANTEIQLTKTEDNPLPEGLDGKVTIASFNRFRRLTSIATPQSYFRKLNGLRSGITYLPIIGKDNKVYLLKITDTGSGFTVQRTQQTLNPLKKAAEVARESFTNSSIPVSGIALIGGGS